MSSPANTLPFALGYGSGGSGSVVVQDGVVLYTPGVELGLNTGSTGSGTMSGSGTQWTTSTWFAVGGTGGGTGNLTVNGGSLSTVQFFVGTTGTGTVTINGGTLSTAGTLRTQASPVGVGAPSPTADGSDTRRIGTVTVTGTGSLWNSTTVFNGITTGGQLHVGEFGSGTLNILGGGTVNEYGARHGQFRRSTGVVLVDGPGSTWNVLHAINDGVQRPGSPSAIAAAEP